ncbi:hypothetical protein QQ008_02055 [Fulvivirgaceae bacterium BMA10]|uniref:Glycosyl hydrolase-like 10 domain-containing protein n=1 Tax=Splendidivirga corallicola TaxID=3051826 RepID=A0ABT8KHC4_9BACT|nr:hypothetical protein [Fulvivirgaceae bacterium BMA10]
MKRRKFIEVLGITTVALSSGFTGISEKKKQYKNWAWLRGGAKSSDQELRDFLLKMKDNHIHGILPSGGNSYYERLGKLCKEVGLEFHAWRWTMNRGGHMKDHPEWYAVSRNGDSVVDKPPYVGYYRWLCPSRPEVKQLLIEDYTTLCKIDGLTGVHLDYVRYCDVILPIALQPKYNLVQDHEMPEFDFCYCEVCRSKFKEEHGTDPLEMEDPTKSKVWRQWRLDQLVEVVNAVADEVHKTGKEISAAVFPTPTIARDLVRQDWERFNLDAFMPMIYFKDYNGDLEWVANVVKEDAKILKKKKAKLYAGLHLGHVRQFGIPKVVETCIENGAQGVTFFMGNSLNDEDWGTFSSVMNELK